MVQCPDCESKDRITIAGKVFCANCGTPWVGPKQAPQPSQATNVAPTTPLINIPTQSPVQVEVPKTLAPAKIKPQVAQSPIASAPKVNPNSQTSTPAQIAVRSSEQREARASHYNQTGSISKFALPTTPNAPSTPAQSDLTAANSQPHVVSPVTIKPTPPPNIPSISSTLPVSQSPENDVEIPDLKDHDQSVLSDSQLSDLAHLDSAPAQPEDTKPINSALKTPIVQNSVVPQTNQPPKPQEPTPLYTVDSSTKPATTNSSNAIPVTVDHITIAPPVTPPSSPTAPATATPINQITSTSPATTPAQPAQRLQDMLAPSPPPPSVPSPAPAPAPTPAATQATNDHLVITPTSAPPSMRLPSNANLDGVSMTRDQALKLALGDSEDQAPSVGSSYRPLKIAIAVVIVLLIGGYIWQINYPNLALKIASARAGIAANAPHYLPNGWSVDHKIVSTQNKLEYTIRSADNKQLRVIQLKSDWDSAALLEGYVSSEAQNIETVQAQGLTIYLYGTGQASWINRGNWFRLDGSSSGLSQEELIKVAVSL